MSAQDRQGRDAKKADAPAVSPSAAGPAIPVDAGQVATLPTLESLKDGTSVFRDLTPEQQKLASDIASKTKFSDPLGIVDFGQQQALDASKVARQLADKTKTMDTGPVGEMATA